MIGLGVPLGGAPRRGTPWLITFVDLVGILLAFFVLQYAMSRFDEARWDKYFGAAADTVRMGADRADRDASLTAELLASNLDAGYLAALLRDRIAAAGLGDIAVAVIGDQVALGLDRLPSGGVAALEPLLRRLPVSVAVQVAVADAADAGLWQDAFAEAGAIAGALQGVGLAGKVDGFAMAVAAEAPRIRLLLDAAGGSAP